jgi:hypothetical protein
MLTRSRAVDSKRTSTPVVGTSMIVTRFSLKRTCFLGVGFRAASSEGDLLREDFLGNVDGGGESLVCTGKDLGFSNDRSVPVPGKT